MCVQHRRAHVGVTEKLLNRANIAAGFKQMSRETMPKRMAARRLSDTRLAHRASYSALHESLMQMVARQMAGVRVPAQ
jgi:hypothetical protein